MKKTLFLLTFMSIFATISFSKMIIVCTPNDGCKTIFIYGDDE